jgi:hypothetical protein
MAAILVRTVRRFEHNSKWMGLNYAEPRRIGVLVLQGAVFGLATGLVLIVSRRPGEIPSLAHSIGLLIGAVVGGTLVILACELWRNRKLRLR